MDVTDTNYYREKDGSLLKLEIWADPDPMNPRTDWDHPGTMVCFHGRYNLGDVKPGRNGATGPIPHTNVRYDNSPDGAEAFVEWAREQLKADNLVIASLNLYDHSGITMSVCDWDEDAFGTGRTGWDSGIVGWIFITKDKVLSEFTVKDGEDWKTRARECLKAEVDVYDDYLCGAVYGFTLYRLSSYKIVENGVEKVRFSDTDSYWEEVDGCGGYYGWDHEKSGILECIPTGAERIRDDELPEVAKEAA